MLSTVLGGGQPRGDSAVLNWGRLAAIPWLNKPSPLWDCNVV